MKCAACQRDCRVTQLALIVDTRAHVSSRSCLRSARVCNTCFGLAIHIVPSVTHVTRGVDETKASRRDAREVASSASKKIRSLAHGYRVSIDSGRAVDPHLTEGRVAGLDQAADILDAGDY